MFQTHTLSCAGTPLFLPPEMFMRHWGPEADLWSLGMVTYQMLSGAGSAANPAMQMHCKEWLAPAVAKRVGPFGCTRSLALHLRALCC